MGILEPWVGIAFLVILNVTIIYVFFNTIRNLSIREIVAEKSPDAVSTAEPSSSRVIGFIGGVTMTCFVWAVANVVIFLGLTKPDEVAPFIGSIGGFLLSGSALFLPYTVNKLAEVGKSATSGSAGTEKVKEEVTKEADDEQKARLDLVKNDMMEQIDQATSNGQVSTDKVKSIVTEALSKASSAG